MTCTRCGAQNPDENLYCQNCGTPLAAQSPPTQPPTGYVGPPPDTAPPLAGPTGYQSPYYAPVGPVAPVHRTSWTLIMAAVVALVVLLGGFGTALAVIANRGSADNSGTAIGTAIPSPTPGLTPTPIASPTPTTLGATTTSNDGVSVRVPQGWSVASKDVESIVLADPNGEGSLTIASGPSVPAQNAQDNKNTVDTYFKSKYPDTRACSGTTTTSGAFNGAKGLSWTLCFTLTDGVHSAPAAASLFAGANNSGSVYYVVMVFTRQDNLPAYKTAAKPVLDSVVWKLS